MFADLKKSIAKFPKIYKIYKSINSRRVRLSRFKDAVLMMIFLHFLPEQTYRFSSRKLLPSKKNKFSKKTMPNIPFEIIKNKSSNISNMKEINIIGRGTSFDLNNLKKMKGPIFLVSFYNTLKTGVDGQIFYEHYDISFPGQDELIQEYNKKPDYNNGNITYVQNNPKVTKYLKNNGKKIICIDLHAINHEGNYSSTMNNSSSIELGKLIDNEICKRLSIIMKMYPFALKGSDLPPASSFLPTLCALSFFAEKVNVYGWDHQLDSAPTKMGYWQLLFNMYKKEYQSNILKNIKWSWNAYFESSFINFYYGFKLSQLPNMNIHGYMGQLGKHEKLINKIERVLFNQ